MKFGVLASAALMIGLGPMAASAQATRPVCTGEDAKLPPEYAGWTSKANLASATGMDGVARASLSVGRAVAATLHPTGQMAYAVGAEKTDGPPGYGGMFDLKIDRPGRYTVALGSGPWVDVVRAGKPLESVAHGHGPDCSTIGKVVAFELQPGRYVVQVVANATATLTIMVARNP